MLNFIEYQANKKYISFCKDLQSLNLNKIYLDEIVSFPRNIYSEKEVIPEIDIPFQNETIYQIKYPMSLHPQHMSKFSYDRGCYFGYCYGPQSGRNYGLGPDCYDKKNIRFL